MNQIQSTCSQKAIAPEPLTTVNSKQCDIRCQGKVKKSWQAWQNRLKTIESLIFYDLMKEELGHLTLSWLLHETFLSPV